MEKLSLMSGNPATTFVQLSSQALNRYIDFGVFCNICGLSGKNKLKRKNHLKRLRQVGTMQAVGVLNLWIVNKRVVLTPSRNLQQGPLRWSSVEKTLF